VLNELSGHVTQYTIDPSKGTLTLVDSVSSVPAEAGLAWGAAQAPVGSAPAPSSVAAKDEKPKVWAADIQITPDGKFLYSTERTTNKIALFTVAPDTGKLTYVTNFATEAQPRGIRIDPTGQYLVASGEKSDRVSVYKIDKGTGKLGEPNRYPVGNGANWVEIVDVQ
jgi:6-phosphogluconolactonase